MPGGSEGLANRESSQNATGMFMFSSPFESASHKQAFTLFPFPAQGPQLQSG